MIRQHQINKVTILLDTDDQTLALHWQNRLSQLFRQCFIHQMEQLFSEMSSDSVIHRIELIDINLGDFNERVSEHQLILAYEEKIVSALERALFSDPSTRIIPLQQYRTEGSESCQVGGRNQVDDEEDYPALKPHRVYHVDMDDINEKESFVNEPSDFCPPLDVSGSDKEQAVIHYLLTGQRFWYQHDEIPINWKQEVLEWGKTSEETLISLIANNPICFKRYMYLVEREDFMTAFSLVKRLVPLFPKGLELFRLVGYRTPVSSWPRIKPYLFDLFLILQHQDVDSDILVDYWFRRVDSDRVIELLNKTFCSQQVEFCSEAVVLIIEELVDKSQSLLKQEQVSKRLDHQPLYPRILASDPDGTSQGELFIDNAGLVLLAPVIPRVFFELHLIEQQDFVSEQEQSIAALLLQSIISSIEYFDESVLSLNKLLCGLLPEDPLIMDASIASERIKTALFIIESFIAEQAVFKDMSRDDFIDIFLKRKGKLVVRDEQWLLVIRSEGRDLFIDEEYYPCFSFQFPWMAFPVQVEFDANVRWEQ